MRAHPLPIRQAADHRDMAACSTGVPADSIRPMRSSDTATVGQPAGAWPPLPAPRGQVEIFAEDEDRSIEKVALAGRVDWSCATSPRPRLAHVTVAIPFSSAKATAARSTPFPKLGVLASVAAWPHRRLTWLKCTIKLTTFKPATRSIWRQQASAPVDTEADCSGHRKARAETRRLFPSGLNEGATSAISPQIPSTRLHANHHITTRARHEGDRPGTSRAETEGVGSMRSADDEILVRVPCGA